MNPSPRIDLHDHIQPIWPLDVEIAFGALPTPVRLHADARFTGKGVTIAFVDAAFYPHPDLVEPQNRIRAWVDATSKPVQSLPFRADELPEWPGWNAYDDIQWHGTMTTCSAAGNGWMSQGIYRGLASEAELVLIQVAQPDGRITNACITRALNWVLAHAEQYNIRVVNLSLGGDPVKKLKGNAVDTAVAALIEAQIAVVVAAGNDGRRSLVPPATAPDAITVGGLDDENTVDESDLQMWHSNYGLSADQTYKPEIVAPSIWVVAPLLPNTTIAQEAEQLFLAREAGDSSVEERIAELKLVTAYYQHVEGTSFATPIVSSTVACLLQANPLLTPDYIRDVLMETAHTVPGAPPERQGAGAVEPGLAVASVLHRLHAGEPQLPQSPMITNQSISFLFCDAAAHQVELFGSWNNWQKLALSPTEKKGLWQIELRPLPPGRYSYKFVMNGERWLDDPANPHKAPDGFGGLNSILYIVS